MNVGYNINYYATFLQLCVTIRVTEYIIEHWADLLYNKQA